MDDLKALSDEDFTALENDVLNERERRSNLARIPESMAAQAKIYVEGGGDLSTLVTALNEA